MIDPLSLVFIGSLLVGWLGSSLEASRQKKAAAIIQAFEKKEIEYNDMISRLTTVLNINSERAGKLASDISGQIRGANRNTLLEAERKLTEDRRNIETGIDNVTRQREQDRSAANAAAEAERNSRFLGIL
jgi:hypothetical protein